MKVISYFGTDFGMRPGIARLCPRSIVTLTVIYPKSHFERYVTRTLKFAQVELSPLNWVLIIHV